MSQTREAKAEPFKDLVHAGHLGETCFGVQAITNSLIIVKAEEKLRILDIYDIKFLDSAQYYRNFYLNKGKDRSDGEAKESISKSHVVMDDVRGYCLSADRRQLAVLVRDQLYIWPLQDILTLDDFKKIRPTSILLESPFLKSDYFSKMSFILDNSHVMLFRHTQAVFIDVKSGKVIKTTLPEDVMHICPLGKNRLVSARREKGVFVQEIRLHDQQIFLESPQLVIKGFSSQCEVSSDGKFIAVAQIEESLAKRSVVKIWSMHHSATSCNPVRLSSCHADSSYVLPTYSAQSTILFTEGNSFLYWNWEFGKCSLAQINLDTKKITVYPKEAGTNTCSVFFDNNICAMPNGDILTIDGQGLFAVSVVNDAFNLRQKAIAESESVAGIDTATKLFAGPIGIVMSYGKNPFFAMKQVEDKKEKFKEVVSQEFRNPV
ncbi:MAG: hypothetical protein ACYCQI_10385 [Gammaproteobacteria bacterium]